MEYTNTEMDAAIADVIHSERDRRLMRRRMIDGIKFEPLAEEFDLSVRHTKTIVESSQSGSGAAMPLRKCSRRQVTLRRSSRCAAQKRKCGWKCNVRRISR